MSFYCIPLVENTLKGPPVSQRRLCVHACPFLTAPAETWIKARQYPHEANETVQIHRSTCVCIHGYEMFICDNSSFLPQLLFRHVKAKLSHLTGRWSKCKLLLCERSTTTRSYCKVHISNDNIMIVAKSALKARICALTPFHSYTCCTRVLRQRKRLFSESSSGVSFSLQKVVSQEVIPCCKTDCSISGNGCMSQENYNMPLTCSQPEMWQ